MTIQQAFELAIQHLQAGRLAEAESICRQILTAEPGHADTLHLLGVIAIQVGRNDAAADLIRQAIAIKPNFPEACNNLGTALRNLGQLDSAIAAHRQAIAINAENPKAHFNLGVALSDSGKWEEAIIAYRQAIAIHPGYVEAYYNLGFLLNDRGQTNEAIAAYRQAIAINPNIPAAHNNLGTALKDTGRLDEAVAAYRQAIIFNPRFPEAYSNLGDALREQGHLDEAIAACRQAISINPALAEAHSNLGHALRDRGQLDEAIAACRKAIAINPKLADAYTNLAHALSDKGQLDEAITACRQAISLKPDSAESHYNLGLVLGHYGELDEAVAEYRETIAIKPNYPEAFNNLGNTLKDKGLLDDAVEAYRQAIALKPDFASADSNLLFALHYHPDYDAQHFAHETSQWNAQHAKPLQRDAQRAFQNDRNGSRQLRVGYVSPDLNSHPVGRSLLQLLGSHDRQHIHITCYSDATGSDATTRTLKGFSDQWRHTPRLSDEQLVRLIEADQIDILVDLAQHTAGNRLLVFARRPAPVQISYGGYPASAGVAAIQYRLTDPYLDPADESNLNSGEKLLRLAHSFWCYPTDEIKPAVNDLPALQMGYIMFGSLNNPCKHSPAAIELWSEVLKAVPGSKLMILVLEQNGYSDYFSQTFKNFGIDPQRLVMVSKRPRAEYMALYNQIDIGLDPLPYNGHMTSCDSFWMGVSVISLRGQTSVGRGGVSLLSNLGLSELIAETPKEYVDIAVGLSRDLTKLNALRRGLRQRMQASPLCDGKRFARNVEELYRQAWAKWCDSAP